MTIQIMFKRLINKNFRKPRGLVGRYIIRFLKKNQIEYDEMEPLLRLQPGDTVLEIGYGLGRGIYNYAGKYDCTFHGIDFSRLMYAKALGLNHDYVRHGKVILKLADFDRYPFEADTFHCVYFLNVIYFWEDISSRLKKIYSSLKPHGKVIMFMADAEYFKNLEQYEGSPVFYRHRIGDVMNTMTVTGFGSIETIEHSLEKKCYYLIGYKDKESARA